MPTEASILKELSALGSSDYPIGSHLVELFKDDTYLDYSLANPIALNSKQFVDDFITQLQAAPDYSHFHQILTTMSASFIDSNNKPIPPKDITEKLTPLLFLTLRFPMKPLFKLNALALQIAAFPAVAEPEYHQFLNRLFAFDSTDPTIPAFYQNDKNSKNKYGSSYYFDAVNKTLKDLLFELLKSQQPEAAPFTYPVGDSPILNKEQKHDEQKKLNEEEEEEDTEADATLGDANQPKLSSQKGGKPKKFKSIPSPTIPTLEVLKEECQSWAHLATYSNYENAEKKAVILQTLTTLAAVLKKEAKNDNDHQAVTVLLEHHQRLMESKDPLSHIQHFGSSATLSDSPIIYGRERPTPSIPASAVRTTTLELSDSTGAHIVTGTLKERHKAGPNSGLVSESILPPELRVSVPSPAACDQLKSWARSAITSLLAASPKNHNKLSFDDGLTPAQLAAAVSYANLLPCDFEIGAMQKLRLIAAGSLSISPDKKALLTDDQWRKLEKGEDLKLDPTLSDKILLNLDTELSTWIKNIATTYPAFSPANWQTWAGEAQNKDSKFPPLGQNSFGRLIADLNVHATNRGIEHVNLDEISLQKPRPPSPKHQPGMFQPSPSGKPFARIGGPELGEEKEKKSESKLSS